MAGLTFQQQIDLARERARLERDLDLPAGSLDSPTSTEPEFVPGAFGSLDGYQSTCTCGLVMRSTMLSSVLLDRRAHARYHEDKARGGAQIRKGRI